MGPFSVSSRGRVGVRAGPVSFYGGGRRRRRSSGSGDDAGVFWALLAIMILFFVVFVAPAAIVGHLFGFTPSIGQIFRNHPAGWMSKHYPSVVGRFAIVDGVLVVALIGFLVLISSSGKSGSTAAPSTPWAIVFSGSDGRTYTGDTRYPTNLAAATAAKSIKTLNVGDRQVSVNGFDVRNLTADSQPEASKRWRVVYLTDADQTFISNGRFASKAEAERVAATVTTVGPEGAQVPVRGFAASIDPGLDPETKKRKRKHQLDSNKSHAYCLGCYRRIYAGDKFCDCGIQRTKGWEEQLRLKTGVRPETRPAATPSDLHIHWLPTQATPAAIAESQVAASEPSKSDTAVPASGTSKPNSASALSKQLRDLADLHSSGALSDLEFEKAKARVLDA